MPSLTILLAALAADPAAPIPRAANPRSLESILRSVRPRAVQPSTDVRAVPAPPAAPPPDDGATFTVATLQFDGNSVFEADALTAAAALPAGGRMTLADVHALADRITDHYRDNGYILARATVPPQDVTDGRLTIRIQEGSLDAVDARGDAAGLHGALADASRRLLAQRPLRLRELEGELALLNRLAGVRARAVLEASPDRPGASRLTLVLTRDRLGATYLADSLGSRESGAARQFLLVDVNGLGGGAGRTLLTLGSSLLDPRLLLTGGIAHEQPVGRGTLVRLSASHSRTRPGGRIAELDIEARSRTAEIGIERAIPRGRSGWLSLGGSLSRTSSSVRLLDEPISRDRVTVAELRGGAERTRASGSVERLELVVQRELGGRQAPDVSRFGAAVTGLTMLARYDALWRLGGQLSLAVEGELRWSSRPQIAARELDFGAAAFGRAFAPGAITGERGGGAMLELRRPLQVAGTPRSWTVEGFGFGEAAALRDLDPLDPKRRGIGSAGGGVRLLAGRVTAELGAAAAVWEHNSSRSRLRSYFRVLSRF